MEEAEESEKIAKLKKRQEHSVHFKRAVEANTEMAANGYDHLEGPDWDKKWDALSKKYANSEEETKKKQKLEGEDKETTEGAISGG